MEIRSGNHAALMHRHQHCQRVQIFFFVIHCPHLLSYAPPNNTLVCSIFFCCSRKIETHSRNADRYRDNML